MFQILLKIFFNNLSGMSLIKIITKRKLLRLDRIKKDNKTIDKPTVPTVPTVPVVPVPVNPDPAATAAALPVEAAKAVSDTPVVAEAVPVNPKDTDINSCRCSGCSC